MQQQRESCGQQHSRLVAFQDSVVFVSNTEFLTKLLVYGMEFSSKLHLSSRPLEAESP